MGHFGAAAQGPQIAPAAGQRFCPLAGRVRCFPVPQTSWLAWFSPESMASPVPMRSAAFADARRLSPRISSAIFIVRFCELGARANRGDGEGGVQAGWVVQHVGQWVPSQLTPAAARTTRNAVAAVLAAAGDAAWVARGVHAEPGRHLSRAFAACPLSAGMHITGPADQRFKSTNER